MLLAAAGSILLGHPAEAAVLLFLFSLSGTLESFAMARTRSAIEGLIRLKPDQALLVEGDSTRKVKVEEVRRGQTIRVLPFEHIPLDGRVVSGASAVDQAAISGESVPASKEAGDTVLAGTQNLDGVLTVEVSTASGDTTLEKMVELVRDAQENKASGERISQWFGQRYTVLVIAAAALSLGLRLTVFSQGWDHAAYASLTLLVALSPCALVISTPASTLSALAFAARKGMLVRGGEFIESSSKVTTVFLDKTGTLTQGEFVLDEICVCSSATAAVPAGAVCREHEACWAGGEEMRDAARSVLRLAAAAEQYSTHPIAEAIVRAAKRQGIELPTASENFAVPGQGVRAVVDGTPVRVGQMRFFEQVPPEFASHANEMRAKGMTVAIMEAGGIYAAFGMRDIPRSDARAALDALRSLGVSRMAMLTGDNDETAHAIAKEVGIDEVRAGLLPEDKETLVAEASAKGTVMFVGDGVNDAPSLARAAVGVAMGGLGSDIALNAADVVIVQDRLDRLPLLIRLGRKTSSIIRANLFFAAGVIFFLALATVFLDRFFPEQRTMILPLAVVGHEGSTVLVILNGLRLLRGPGSA